MTVNKVDNLPQSWTNTTLSSLLIVLRGVSYKKEDACYNPGEGLVPILRANNINSHLVFDELVYVPQQYVSNEQLLIPGDIVVAASSGSSSVVGKAAAVQTEWFGSFGAFCFGLRPFPQINAKLIAYYLQTSEYRNRVSELASGVNINNLRRQHIESTPFKLPPFNEQHRIVEEIEKQFSRLDEAVANLKRVQANLKRYRASVLQTACEGRLVPTEAETAHKENRDYEPADQLLQRILIERRRKWEENELAKMLEKGKEPKDDKWKARYNEPTAPDKSGLPELPEGWCWATAEQLTSVITDGEHITPARSSSGVYLLSARNVLNGVLSLHQVDYVSEETYEKICRRLIIIEGDVLLSCSGTVGRSCVVPPNIKFTLVRSVAVLKPVIKMGDFISYAIRSPLLQEQISDKKTETAQANIFQGKIKTLVFPLPPYNEQERINAEIERCLSLIDKLESVTDANLKRAEKLRQAILKQAFEGKLVPQDPADEPAEILLERIKSEQAVLNQRNGKKARVKATEVNND